MWSLGLSEILLLLVLVAVLAIQYAKPKKNLPPGSHQKFIPYIFYFLNNFNDSFMLAKIYRSNWSTSSW